jgi:hypothetical protein
MATINCPECNTEIDSEIAVCPCCGFPIKKKPTTQTEPKLSEVPTQPISEEKRKQKKLIGTVMCIIGCICFIIAITRVTNEEYKFYVEHYEDCKEGYEDCMDEAKYGGMFSGSYRSIASTYEDMMEDDMKEIWKYRGTAIACCIAGIGLVFVGYKNIKKGGEA